MDPTKELPFDHVQFIAKSHENYEEILETIAGKQTDFKLLSDLQLRVHARSLGFKTTETLRAQLDEAVFKMFADELPDAVVTTG